MYGLVVRGFRQPEALLVPVPPDWPELTVIQGRPAEDRRRPSDQAPGFMRFDEREAEVWLNDAESIAIDRASMEVRLATNEPVSDDALAHPYLGLPAAVASRWLGREILHGGAFLKDGAAWGVLGTKEAGKSSTLGWLHRAGLPILSDDLLVLDGRMVFAGPRCVDLREETAEILGGRDVGVLGGRARWRLSATDLAPVVPLAGFIHLEWGEKVATTSMQPSDALLRLFDNVVCGPDGGSGAAFLDLAGLPSVRFIRPRSFDVFDDAISQLLAALA